MASTDELRYRTRQGTRGNAPPEHRSGDDHRADPGCLAADRQPLCQAFTSTVLSFGKVIANGATNVIPDKVCLEGTFRTLNEESARRSSPAYKKQMAEQIAESMGGL